MGLQIDKLLENYWNGETSLEEEKVIKAHFKSNPALTNECHYFRYIAKEKQVDYMDSKKINKKRSRLFIAASITVGLIVAVLVFNDANKDPFAIEDPKKAFEATKNALMMISGELKEGKNHTLELSKFTKAQEELQKGS